MWQLWVSFVIGLWMIVSPYLLGFSDVSLATWNNILAGLIVAVLTYWGVTEHNRMRAG